MSSGDRAKPCSRCERHRDHEQSAWEGRRDCRLVATRGQSCSDCPVRREAVPRRRDRFRRRGGARDHPWRQPDCRSTRRLATQPALAVGAAKAVVCADGPLRQGQAPAAGVLVQRAARREGGVRRARQRGRSADRRHRAAPRHARVHEHPRPSRHPPDRRDRDRERPAGDLQPARSRAR